MSFTLDDLREWSSEAKDFYWDDLNNDWKSYDSPFGLVKWVVTDTDYDEGRQNLEMVFRVADRFFRKTGWYDSWDGGGWDGELEEVRPREKMITVYEAI